MKQLNLKEGKARLHRYFVHKIWNYQLSFYLISFFTGMFSSYQCLPDQMSGWKLASFYMLYWKFLIYKHYRHVLRGLAVVLQDDGDVHVDDDQEADDEVGEEEGDGHDGVAAVSLVTRLRVSCGRK